MSFFDNQRYPGTLAVPGKSPIKNGIKAGPVVEGKTETAFLRHP
jgi:hypothetical protein